MTFCIAGTVWQTKTQLLTILTFAPYLQQGGWHSGYRGKRRRQTFTAHLNAPCAYFLDLCAFPAFYPVPQQAVEAADGADTNPGAWALEAGFVGSGPFVLTEWKHNESMTYEPNPNYWAADKVSLTKINFMLSSDDTAIYNAFQDGSLQFADTIPTDMMATVKDTPEYHKIPTLGTYYCGFNVNSELFAGKTVEEAAAMKKHSPADRPSVYR